MARGHGYGLRNSQLEVLTKGFTQIVIIPSGIIYPSIREDITPWTTTQKKCGNFMLLRKSDATRKGWVPIMGHLKWQCDYESNKNMPKMI